MLADNRPHPIENNRRDRRLVMIGLTAILLLGVFLRFYQLGADGYGNTYYAATVKSMLTSWHNFFFAAYEPGGSVSVDKPPLGFWIEALSALIFGFNGFALAFPNALAGVLSVYLLYDLVQRSFGKSAGLIASLALAATPVTVAAERNNTIDGLLVFFLLLAARAVFTSIERKKVGYLILGAVLVGLAFNIKMLQAYMVLPALYLLYFFGARFKWGQRLLHLGLATVVLAVVSLSWALIVDAVPASQRPYIGSTRSNSVMELIGGHNGIERFTSAFHLSDSSGEGTSISLQPTQGPGSGTNPGTASLNGAGGGIDTQQAPRLESNLFRGTLGVMEEGLGGVIYEDIGDPGILRLFRSPLAVQASWLLPLAFLSLALFAALQKKLGASPENRLGVFFWAGWLIPCFLFFSFTGGLWHVYYLIMLGPAIAALTGLAFWTLQRMTETLSRRYALIFTAAGLLTVVFEIYAVSSYVTYALIFAYLAMGCWVTAAVVYWLRPRPWSAALVTLALIIAPLFWSGLAGVNSSADGNLPRAEPALQDRSAVLAHNNQNDKAQQVLVDYLLANTKKDTYLVASLDSFETSGLILSTSRPVLTLGGFKGLDNVIDPTGLQAMVDSGKLRYVLDEGNLSYKAAIYTWVKENCSTVKPSAVQGLTSVESMTNGLTPTIYDCYQGEN